MDGEALTFGNQGALFMNAMTWWDHETDSVWSQPWGSALAGPLEDTALTLLPVSVVPWSTWLAEHPDTTVVANDLTPRRVSNQLTRDDFVIGVALGDAATAYYYVVASEERVINDRIGDHPVVVTVDPDTRDIKVFLRNTGDEAGIRELIFELDESGLIVDGETGSVWDTTRGVAVDGLLKGTLLQQLPYVSSFDWAWLDFFPHTEFYGGDFVD